MKVFVGPTEIAGIGEGLMHGFTSLGISADLVTGKPHAFAYSRASSAGLNRLWESVGARRTKKEALAPVYGLVHGLLKWAVMLRAAVAYDAFIFIFAKTITNTRVELMLLRLLRKKIIFVYVGSDVRPAYIGNVGQASGLSAKSMLRVQRRSARAKQRVAMHEKYADYLVNSPSTAQFHSKRFINWFALGIPRHFSCSSVTQDTVSDAVRVLHAPSKPLTKGTPNIVAAIKRLRSKGHKIDLVMIQNMPNATVLAEMARCDFIVDELYSDTPMAVFASEAAYFGKPAVIGGYFSSEAKSYIAPDDMPPSLFVEPDDLEVAIEKLIVDRAFRLDLGLRAQQFVTSRWSPGTVAARYLKLILDDVPESWWFQPENVQYVYGCGVPRERMNSVVSSLVKHLGISALQLAHNPTLEMRFARLADEDFSK